MHLILKHFWSLIEWCYQNSLESKWPQKPIVTVQSRRMDYWSRVIWEIEWWAWLTRRPEKEEEGVCSFARSLVCSHYSWLPLHLACPMASLSLYFDERAAAQYIRRPRVLGLLLSMLLGIQNEFNKCMERISPWWMHVYSVQSAHVRNKWIISCALSTFYSSEEKCGGGERGMQASTQMHWAKTTSASVRRLQ